MNRRAVLLSAGAAALSAAARASEPPLAFPGAVGWARATPGGRGGRLIRVTTLAASGAGSFREAIEAKGPRTVVFEVGGVIDLDGQILNVREPYLTVAGQTAPSPGITLIRGGLNVRAHDVVLRHLRVRPGEAGRAKNSGWEVDGICVIGAAYDVIVDHCSCTWATDENLSASGPRFEGEGPAAWRSNTARRITFSQCLIAEGLSNATHSKGEHSKGTLIHDNVTEALIWGCLYAHNRERNPLFKGGTSGAVVNCVTWDPGKRTAHYNLHAGEWGDHPWQTGRLSQVGNVVRLGPSSDPSMAAFMIGGDGPLELYQADNLAFDAAGRPLPPTSRFGPGAAVAVRLLDRPPLWPEGLAARPAAEVEAWVLANAGARPWDRDAVDRRIVEQVRSRTGRIIDSEQEVGGYPVQAETRRPFEPGRWSLDTMTERA